jgi:RNA recognition motif-containing protein
MSAQEQTIMRLYVGGLPYQTSEQDLLDLFGQTGHVSGATVITDRDTGRSKGFAFVEMSDEKEARAAIEQLNGTQMGDRTIVVNEARERQSTGSRGSQGRERHSNNSSWGNRY